MGFVPPPTNPSAAADPLPCDEGLWPRLSVRGGVNRAFRTAAEALAVLRPLVVLTAARLDRRRKPLALGLVLLGLGLLALATGQI